MLYSRFAKAGLAAASAIFSAYMGVHGLETAYADTPRKEVILEDGCTITYSEKEAEKNISQVTCPDGFAIYSRNSDGKADKACLSENQCLDLGLASRTGKEKAVILDVRNTLEKRLAEIKTKIEEKTRK